MNDNQLEEANLTNVDLETQEETNLNNTDLQSSNGERLWIKNEFVESFFLSSIILIIMFITPYIVPFLFSGTLDIYEYITFDQTYFNTLKINLTSQERSEITQKMSIICNMLSSPQMFVEYFKPLINSKIKSKAQSNLIPLNKISFMISSSPSTLNLTKLYLDMWSTKFGSRIIKNTGIQPLKTVYWEHEEMRSLNFSIPKLTNLENNDQIANFKIALIDETNSYNKWTFMLSHNFKHVPSDVEWFILMDNKTLPFLDRITPMLSKYNDPLNTPYLIRSPRKKVKTNTTNYSNNIGAGYYLSRKLVETIVPKLQQCENQLDIDFKLDKCIKSITDVSPILDYGIFHMDPMAIKGNLAGLIEGYIDRYDLKAIHNVEDYYLFPKQFLNMMREKNLYNAKTINNPKYGSDVNLSFESFPIARYNFFSQEALFAQSAAAAGDMFLKRYIIMFPKDDKFYFGLLNCGYSLVVFDIEYKLYQHGDLLREILKYLSGVEQTFEVLSDALYKNLTRLLVPEAKRLHRYYIKKSVQYKFGTNAFSQEYCDVTSPSTIAKIYVNNRKISLENFYPIFK